MKILLRRNFDLMTEWIEIIKYIWNVTDNNNNNKWVMVYVCKEGNITYCIRDFILFSSHQYR